MNNHPQPPACYRTEHGHQCKAYGTPPNMETMRKLTKGCEGCKGLTKENTCEEPCTAD